MGKRFYVSPHCELVDAVEHHTRGLLPGTFEIVELPRTGDGHRYEIVEHTEHEAYG